MFMLMLMSNSHIICQYILSWFRGWVKFYSLNSSLNSSYNMFHLKLCTLIVSLAHHLSQMQMMRFIKKKQQKTEWCFCHWQLNSHVKNNSVNWIKRKAVAAADDENYENCVMMLMTHTHPFILSISKEKSRIPFCCIFFSFLCTNAIVFFAQFH